MAHQTDNTNHNQHHSSGNGFLLGVIIGVILTLLFTTKRGRIILKELLEKGIEKFSNLEDFMKEATERAESDIDEEFDDEDDFVPSAPVKIIEAPKAKVEEKPQPTVKIESAKEVPAPTKAKREETVEVKKEAVSKVEEKEAEPETKASEKTKPVGGKRWFRGLRKKS
ncbi:MAG TPA: hypothetical protein VLF93_02770 [Candidatus Saccharimonadales bacterium]|nr:hypothetical protein [Candidatus Saccharimonadales bacterium]